MQLGCALVFASEAKIGIEAKISFCLQAKKRHDFAWFTSKRNSKNLKRKWTENKRKLSEKIEAKRKWTEKLLHQEKIWSENKQEVRKIKQKNRSKTKKNLNFFKGDKARPSLQQVRSLYLADFLPGPFSQTFYISSTRIFSRKTSTT